MICVFRCVLATLCHFQKSIWDSGTKQTHTNMRKTELAQLLAGISLRKLNRSILLAEKDRKMSVPVLDELCDIVKSLRQHIIHGKAVAEFLCTYPQCGSPPKHRSLPSFHTQNLPRWTIALTLEKNQNTCLYFFCFNTTKMYSYYSISTSFLALKEKKTEKQTPCCDMYWQVTFEESFPGNGLSFAVETLKGRPKWCPIAGNALQHQWHPAALPRQHEGTSLGLEQNEEVPLAWALITNPT